MNTNSSFLKALFLIAFMAIGGFFFTANAQNKVLKSRVAAVSNEIKTNIWVSDFPKKTSIVITDEDNNLLSIICTNDYGAAFLSIPVNIKSGIIARTLDGEIIASNKALIKDHEEPNVVSNESSRVSKA